MYRDFCIIFQHIDSLQKAIKSKRPGLLKWKVILLYDNITPHSAELTQSLLNQLKQDVFHHRAYSPDLAPSDYHLIPGLKRDLGGWHFTMEADLRSTVTSSLLNRTLSGIALITNYIKKVSNKSCSKLNFLLKTQWVHVSISSRNGAKGV